MTGGTVPRDTLDCVESIWPLGLVKYCAKVECCTLENVSSLLFLQSLSHSKENPTVTLSPLDAHAIIRGLIKT